MAQCTSCGALVDAGNRFCGYCGAPQDTVDSTQASAAGADSQTTNAMAVASLIAGVLWFGGLGSIVAIMLGMFAKRDIAESHGRQGGEGYATAGIVLGWVGLTITLILLVGLCASSDELGDGGSVSSLERAGFVLDVTSELESAANEQENVLADTGSYTSDPGELQHDEYVGVEMTIVAASEDGFCLEATHERLNGNWYISDGMDSAQRGSC